MGLKRRSIISIIIIVAFLIGSALFMLRAPVVLVLDDAFIGLYGARRTLIKQAGTSLKLRRPVKLVRIAAGAAADVAAFAAADAAAGPYAVLFPYIYRQGARRYAEQTTGIPIGVLGTPPGGDDGTETGNLVFIAADRKTDLYRVGRCAAIFARFGGGVLFFTGEVGNEDARQAFSKGLRDQGFENPPLFVDRGQNYTPSEGISCVVIAAPAENYLDTDPAIPTILFSWLDPDITPREIKLIVDDSPWAQAEAAVKLLHRTGGAARTFGPAPVPSEILAPKGRIGGAEFQQDIQKALESRYLD